MPLRHRTQFLQAKRSECTEERQPSQRVGLHAGWLGQQAQGKSCTVPTLRLGPLPQAGPQTHIFK